jgi:hypothetical protein
VSWRIWIAKRMGFWHGKLNGVGRLYTKPCGTIERVVVGSMEMVGQPAAPNRTRNARQTFSTIESFICHEVGTAWANGK